MSGNLIWAIIAFGIMIFGHELGHFLVAKRVGITVQAFALGFGPKLVGVTRGETLYAINLIPFGGYVKLAGEDLQDGGGPNTFRAKSVWQRMAVLAAGPMMNLLLALILLAGLALVLGVPSGVTNRIGQVLTDCFDAGHRVPCPAKQAGLQDGDAIVAIDGRPVARGGRGLRDWSDRGGAVSGWDGPGRRRDLPLYRGGDERPDRRVQPAADPRAGRGSALLPGGRGRVAAADRSQARRVHPYGRV